MYPLEQLNEFCLLLKYASNKTGVVISGRLEMALDEYEEVSRYTIDRDSKLTPIVREEPVEM